MTSPTKHDLAGMRNAEKRRIRDFKPALWIDMRSVTAPASNAVAVDSSGNKHHADLTGFSEAQLAAGWQSGGGLDFDGATNRATSGSRGLVTTNASHPGGSWSMVARFRTATKSAVQCVVGESADGATRPVSGLYVLATSGYAYLLCINNAGTAVACSGNVDITDGEEHTIVGVYNAATAKLKGYCDGVAFSSGEANVASCVSTPTDCGIGFSERDTDGRFFNGTIYECGKFAAALTADDAVAYHAGTWPAIAPVAKYVLTKSGDGAGYISAAPHPKSGASFVQATEALRPLIDDSATAADFDGVDDVLVHDGEALTGTSGNLFCVASTANETTKQVLYSQADAGGSDSYLELGVNANNKMFYKCSSTVYSLTATEEIRDADGTMENMDSTTGYTSTVPAVASCAGGFAAVFAGNTQGIRTGQYLGGMNGDLTISFWIKLHTSVAVTNYVINNGRLNVGVYNRRLNVSSDGATLASSADDVLTLDTWMHVFITRTAAGVVNIRVNDTATGTADQASGSTFVASTMFTIGNRNALDRGVPADIDDLRMYSAILDASDNAILVAGAAEPVATPYYHWKFDSGPTLTVTELEGEDVLGTTQRVLEWSSTGTAIAMKMDGYDQEITVVSGANTGQWFGDLTSVNKSAIGAGITAGTAADFLNGNVWDVVAIEPIETASNATRLRRSIARRHAITLAAGFVFAFAAGSIALDETGRIAAMQLPDGTSVQPPSDPVIFLTSGSSTIRNPISAQAKAGHLHIHFEGGTIADFTVTQANHYALLELTELRNEESGLTRFTMLKLPISTGADIATRLSAAEYNSDSAVGLVCGSVNVWPLQVDTSTRLEVRTLPSTTFAPCKYGIIMCHPDDFQVAADAFATAASMPAVVAANTAIVQGSYVFLNTLAASQTQDAIDYATAGGFEAILLAQWSWCQSSGHNAVNTTNWPNGLPDLVTAAQAFKAAGLKVGLHIYAPSIEVADAYITPVPDARLYKDSSVLLASDVTDSATTIATTTAPGTLFPASDGGDGGLGAVIQIGDELILYTAKSTTEPYGFTGCTRGYHGTTAAAHTAGDTVSHLKRAYGRFMPDFSTTLLDEMTANFAVVADAIDADMVYLDAAELLPGQETSFFWHANGTLVKSYCDALTRTDVLFQVSSQSPYSWFLCGRDTIVDGILDLKASIEGRAIYFNDFANRIMPMDFGWYRLESALNEIDSYEYLLCQSIGWDSSMSLVTRVDWIAAHAEGDEILALFSAYETLRLSGRVTEEIKSLLRYDAALGRREYTLVSDVDGDRFLPLVDGVPNEADPIPIPAP